MWVNLDLVCLCVSVYFSSSLQLLLSKLEKNKAMKAEDKAKCMTTLSMLIKSISKLQEEIKGMSSSNSQHRTAKSKAQVFTVHSCVRIKHVFYFLILCSGSYDHHTCPPVSTMSSDLYLMTWWEFTIQAQKELLDAELDLYKKSQSGEDTAMLQLQYTQLQIEVMFSYPYSTLQMMLS